MSNVNSTVLSVALAFVVVGPLAQFLKEMGLATVPETTKVYRDLKTGKFVSAKVILDLMDDYRGKTKLEEAAFVDQDEDSVTDEDNRVGEVFASALTTVDVLPALPNWESMSLEEILPRVAYHKKHHIGGVSSEKTKVAMTQKAWVREGSELVEKDVLIPVASAGDGGEYRSFMAAGGEDPETVSLNAAVKARAKLVEWEEMAIAQNAESIKQGKEAFVPVYRVDEIDAWIERLRGGVSESNLHPFSDGEDVAEALWQRLVLKGREEKREERKAKIEKMESVFASMGTKGIKFNFLKARCDALGQHIVDSMTKDGSFTWDSEKVFAGLYWGLSTGFKDEETGRWIVETDRPMGYILRRFEKVAGNGAKFNGDFVNKNHFVKEGVKAMIWQAVVQADKAIEEWRKGTISRYVGHMLNVLEVTEVRQDKQRRQIGIDASPAWKTVHADNYKPETVDYLEMSRLDQIHKHQTE